MKKIFFFLSLGIFFVSCDNSNNQSDKVIIGGKTWLLNDSLISVDYSWKEAMNACPNGYHLPDLTEWNIFLTNSSYLIKHTNGDSLNISYMEFWTSTFLPVKNIHHPYLPITIKNRITEVNTMHKTKKARIICVLDSEKNKEPHQNSFFSPFSFREKSPACIKNYLYVDYLTDSLYLCDNGEFKRLNSMLFYNTDTLNIHFDGIVRSLKYMSPCTYGLNNKIFMTGSNRYLYKCQNYQWEGMGYMKLPIYSKGDLHDSISGETYKTITVGKTKWMAENLRKKNSSSICYDNNQEICAKYGRLYTSYKEGLCPSGWKLPSEADWQDLFSNVGYNASFIRSKEGWIFDFKENNDLGLSIYPAGWSRKIFNSARNSFDQFGMNVAWYSYDNYNKLFSTFFDGESFYHSYEIDNLNLYIRCIQKD